MLLLATSMKLVAEIALMALIGQWIVGLLAGPRRDGNLFYRLLKVLTEPFLRGARLISPRVVIDRHVPLVAFVLLGFGWVAATVTKIQLCVEIGVQACR
jgi:hypothetical protein